jgi:hypothetical protein
MAEFNSNEFNSILLNSRHHVFNTYWTDPGPPGNGSRYQALIVRWTSLASVFGSSWFICRYLRRCIGVPAPRDEPVAIKYWRP